MMQTARGALLLILGCCSLHGLSAAKRARFEVASVKPSPPSSVYCGDMRGVDSRPGRMTLQYAVLRTIILWAFSAKPWEITGIPAWASSARYDIAAKAEGPASLQQMWPMLVPLLEERFGMKWHREKRVVPVFNLSVAKSGKLPAPQAGSCVGSDPRVPPPKPAPGKPLLTACGSILMPVTPPGAKLYGGKVRMAALVGRLTDLLGRPVIDKTGFTGEFDLQLQFALDDSLAISRSLTAVPGQPEGAAQASDPPGLPSIFSALREQLGLRVDSAKGPAEVIVIDSLQRPTAN